MKRFHEVWAGNGHECSLESRIGKARIKRISCVLRFLIGIAHWFACTFGTPPFFDFCQVTAALTALRGRLSICAVYPLYTRGAREREGWPLFASLTRLFGTLIGSRALSQLH